MVVIFINDPYDPPKKIIDGQYSISSFVVKIYSECLMVTISLSINPCRDLESADYYSLRRVQKLERFHSNV